MRLHPVNLLIAVLAGALLAYALWSMAGRGIQDAIGVGSFVLLASALACSVGIRFDDERVGTSVKLLGSVFFVLALVLNLVFAFAAFSQTAYVITSGLCLLLFAFLANAVYSADQA